MKNDERLIDKVDKMVDSLNEMNVNMAVVLQELKNQRDDIQENKEKLEKLKETTDEHGKHVTIVKTSFQAVSILGAVLVFMVKAMPYIHSIFK